MQDNELSLDEILEQALKIKDPDIVGYLVCINCDTPFVPRSKQHSKFCTRKCKTAYNSKKFYETNIEKVKEYRKRYQLNHPYNEAKKQYHNKKSNEHYHKNKDRYKFRNIKRKYGITEEEYKLLLQQQNNRCAICLKENKNNEPLHLDHCHSTNKVRGLLCNNCNLGIGNLQENLIIIKRAYEYLEKWNR